MTLHEMLQKVTQGLTPEGEDVLSGLQPESTNSGVRRSGE